MANTLFLKCIPSGHIILSYTKRYFRQIQTNICLFTNKQMLTRTVTYVCFLAVHALKTMLSNIVHLSEAADSSLRRYQLVNKEPEQ